MNTDLVGARGIAKVLSLCVVLTLVVGCATHSPDGTGLSGDPRDDQATLQPDNSSNAEITAASIKKLGSPQLLQKKDIVSMFGKPVSEERVPNHDQYVFFSYFVRDWNEHLYILFYKEDLLGYAREQGKASLRDTIRHHERVQGGRIVLFQSSSNGKTTFFVARQEQLAEAPKWSRKSKATPPVSTIQAEQRAMEWLKSVEPNTVAEPKVHELLEVKSFPGAAFYIVRLWMAERGISREVVVLMDGSVIAGEVEATL